MNRRQNSDGFRVRDGALYAEDVAVNDLAERFGTPLYVYSRNHLRGQFREIVRAMRHVSPLVCYSVKANSNASVIRTFVDEGAGLDVVSGGELFRGLRAGADAGKVVFAGVGKTREEIEYALKQNILFFTVESESEAQRISEIACATGTTGRIAFRVNPDVDPKTHKYISTGKKENKFGLDLARTAKAYAAAAALPGIEIAGLHMHIGSQILQVEPFASALAKVAPLIAELKARHPSFRFMDMGGGLGIRYRPDTQPPTAAAFAEAVAPLLKKMRLQVVMEPGRRLVGNAGILVCRVQYVKNNAFKKFVIVDAGMNDLIRPSLYEAHHEVVAVRERGGVLRGDLVGPICESGDFLALDRDLPAAEPGDLLAVMSAGAYGYAMASNYNSRPRPAEIMVDGTTVSVVRERETWDDLVRGEPVPVKG
jgi:diaminopimelate decarboxylase